MFVIFHILILGCMVVANSQVQWNPAILNLWNMDISF